MKKLLLSLFASFVLLLNVLAQERTVTGTVSAEEDGLPLPGVSVRIKGTSLGTQTSGNGKFSIKVPSTSSVLEFTYIGFSSISRTVGSSAELSVSMKSDAKSLNEVVVTGAGLSSRKKEVGTAQTTLSNSQLTQAKPTNIVSGLTGKVAGLNIQGVSGGVNPNYRIVLRGMRSITGNNEALVVIDNVITPNSILSNLNPDDIEDLTILNGSSSAALYGSAASNGAIIITTKRGKKDDSFQVKVANTTTVEQVAFFPQLQKDFGSGSANDVQVYTPYENQQYGPKFDGSIKPIGNDLQDGSIMSVPYSWTDSKYDFWESGLTNMTDFSITSGGAKGSIFASAQYMNATGTTPGDKYNRATVRIGGSKTVSDKIFVNYSAYYAQNRNNLTTQTSNIYNYLLNAPGQVPLTELNDWRNDPFANPNGYFNAYYNNPYFMADNYRQKTRNDYFIGSAEVKYVPVNWLDFTGRVGLTSQNQTDQQYSDIFMFSDFTKSWAGSSTYKQQDILGGDREANNYTTNIVGDFIAHAQKKTDDFKFDFSVLGQLVQNQYSSTIAEVKGLVTPGLFNLGNSVNTPTASNERYLQRLYGLSGVINVGFKDYLFLKLTGRNDWVSTLSPENRSFFYPSVNLSFVPTDAFSGLKSIDQIDYIKLRGGWSKVGQVNIGTRTSFGAYGLQPVFTQGSGYPYNGLGGLTQDNVLVSADLKPEITSQFETGIDFSLFKSKVVSSVTYFNSETVDNTVQTGVSSTTGYANYLVNAGTTTSKGVEATLAVTPYRTSNWEITLGGNYTYLDNKVKSISADLDRLSLGGYTNAGSYAVAGQPFPVIVGKQYVRDDQGRIIVDPVTGYPSATSTLGILGSAQPDNILGLNATVRFKQFTLYGSGEFRTGNVIYNAGGSTFDFSGAGINSASYNRDRFVIPNSSYLDPATGKYVANTNITVRDGGPGYWTIAGPRMDIAENYITSAAFWKVRELSLSYDIPTRFLQKSKIIKAARLSVQGRNLFIWLPNTNVYTDPEYSDGNNLNNGNAIGLTNLGQTPPSRYYGATLSVTL